MIIRLKLLHGLWREQRISEISLNPGQIVSDIKCSSAVFLSDHSNIFFFAKNVANACTRATHSTHMLRCKILRPPGYFVIDLNREEANVRCQSL